MAQIAHAEFDAKCDGNYQSALERLQIAASKYPNSHYPLLVRAYLAARQGDLQTLRDAHNALKELSVDRTFSENSMVRLNAYIYCLSGDLSTAISYAESSLRDCPQHARESFITCLREMAANRTHDR